MRNNPGGGQTPEHQRGCNGMSPLRSVRHEPAQARPQGQQYHRKHNRKRHETTTQAEEETLRAVVTEFKGRRDNASDRMKNGGNQNGEDKSSDS